MIDIVTVAFEQELSILRVQAQSIDLYCRDIGIKNIVVIVNDKDSVADRIDPAWWGNLQSLVKIVPRRYFRTEFVENGWLSQQALKLMAHELVHNPWYIVLDAKTIFVKPLLLSEAFVNEKLQIGWQPIYPVFDKSRQITNDIFEIDLKSQLGPGGVPFFFYTSAVRDMIDFVQEKTGREFAEWFQAQGMLTEFICYSGWVRKQNLQKLYAYGTWFTVCNICHSEVGIADQKLKSMSELSNLTVSIHRGAWAWLVENRQVYRDFLISRGLTQATTL